MTRESYSSAPVTDQRPVTGNGDGDDLSISSLTLEPDWGNISYGAGKRPAGTRWTLLGAQENI